MASILVSLNVASMVRVAVLARACGGVGAGVKLTAPLASALPGVQPASEKTPPAPRMPSPAMPATPCTSSSC